MLCKFAQDGKFTNADAFARTPPPQKGALTGAANQIVSGSKCGAGGGQWTSISMTSLQVGVCVKSPGFDCVFS